jgi:hypothetical protein
MLGLLELDSFRAESISQWKTSRSSKWDLVTSESQISKSPHLHTISSLIPVFYKITLRGIVEGNFLTWVAFSIQKYRLTYTQSFAFAWTGIRNRLNHEICSWNWHNQKVFFSELTMADPSLWSMWLWASDFLNTHQPGISISHKRVKMRSGSCHHHYSQVFRFIQLGKTKHRPEFQPSTWNSLLDHAYVRSLTTKCQPIQTGTQRHIGVCKTQGVHPFAKLRNLFWMWWWFLPFKHPCLPLALGGDTRESHRSGGLTIVGTVIGLISGRKYADPTYEQYATTPGKPR